MPLGPIVSRAILAENKVVGPEDLSVGPGTQTVHRTGLEIHQHRSGDVPPTTCLIVVDIHPLKLNMRVTDIVSGGIDAVLVAHHLPELAPDLVTALPGLDVKNFSHFFRQKDVGRLEMA